jgi:hypothetical protein
LDVVDLVIHSEQLRTGNFARAGSPDPVQKRLLPQIRRSLASRGVLFLDELPGFGSRVPEVLRQPVEDKIVAFSRAQGSLTFPANFQMVAALYLWTCSSK